MIEKVKCSMNLDALRHTPTCTQENVLFVNKLGNEVAIELRIYKIAVRTVFVDQMHWSLPILAAESKLWYAYCNISQSNILLVISTPISLDSEATAVEHGIFFYRMSTRDLSLIPVFPVASSLAISRVIGVICWPGKSGSLQKSTILLIGIEEPSGNTICSLIESKGVQILGRASEMRILCHSERIALLSLHTTMNNGLEKLLPSGIYLIQCPHYEMTRISSDDHANQEMAMSQGLMLKHGFFVFVGKHHGRSALTIHYLVADSVPKLIMCTEIRLPFPLQESHVLMFDTYHSVFIIDSSSENYCTKEARRVDLLSLLVCTIGGANATQFKYTKSLLALLTKAVTEGLHEAQIDRAASAAVASRLMSHTNNTVDNFNSALARAQRLEEADVKQRKRISELEEERKGDDARLAQIVQKNKEMERRTIDQLDIINAYKDTIGKLQDTRDVKKELLTQQVQNAMNHVSSLTRELQSLIEEVDSWS